MNEKLYSEILDEFENCKTDNERISVLRKNDSPRFREFLICVFHPNVQFEVTLPEKYRPAQEPAGLNYTYLHHEVPKFYRFMKNHPKRPPGYIGRKQSIDLLVILESLHHDEAALFLGMLKKNLDIKFLTTKIIKEAYPDIKL